LKFKAGLETSSFSTPQRELQLNDWGVGWSCINGELAGGVF
jgi:hypothetical protein